jgi:DNA-binding GntR family transcriptional regulator
MERLMSMLGAAWNLTEPHQPMALIDAGDRGRLHAEHHQMLSAFVARDAVALAALAAEHQHDLERSIGALAARDTVFAARSAANASVSDVGAPPSAANPR